MFDLLDKWFGSTLGANKNCGRWSDMVAVMFPDIASHESTFEKILSMDGFRETSKPCWLQNIWNHRICGQSLEIHWWVGVHDSFEILLVVDS